jgi:isoleucyl-tRNA synthetase
LTELKGTEALATARAVESGLSFEIQVDGQLLQLEPGEVLMDVTSPEGYTVAGRNRLLVALNTSLTPELRLEGQARDLVRFIQDGRKSADFNITDRILVTLESRGDVDLVRLLEIHGDYVRAETLANSLTIGPASAGAFTVEADLEGGAVLAGLRRARA